MPDQGDQITCNVAEALFARPKPQPKANAVYAASKERGHNG
jgi:hypothetical protein